MTYKLFQAMPINHTDADYSPGQNQTNHLNRRPSAMPDIRIPLNAKIIPKQLGGGKVVLANAKNPVKKKKKTQVC